MRNREMTTDVRHQTSEMSDVSLTSDSNFVIRDARGLLLVVGEIDLKIGKQRGRFARKRAQARDRHPADLELRALATSQLEHRAPGTRVARHDDLHFGRVGEDTA